MSNTGLMSGRRRAIQSFWPPRTKAPWIWIRFLRRRHREVGKSFHQLPQQPQLFPLRQRQPNRSHCLLHQWQQKSLHLPHPLMTLILIY